MGEINTQPRQEGSNAWEVHLPGAHNEVHRPADEDGAIEVEGHSGQRAQRRREEKGEVGSGQPQEPACDTARSGGSAMENGPVSVLPYTLHTGTPRE